MAHSRSFIAPARALLLWIAMTSAGHALTAPMACLFVPELGRFLGADEPAPSTAQSILPDTFASGIVYFEVGDLFGQGDRSRWLVVQQCGTSAGLVLRINPDDASVRARFDQMIFGTQPYTMRDVVAEISTMGAQIHLQEVQLGSCPCDHQQFFYGK